MQPKLVKDLDMVLLLDCYGSLLTQRQREAMTLYYEQDLSLSEMAEDMGVTRQAAHDLLHRACGQLQDWESRVGMMAKCRQVDAFLADMLQDLEAQSTQEIRARLTAFADSWKD